jgi:hypothetical protein
MIEGLQIQNDTQNGKVFYHPVVLTVNGSSKFRDTDISFKEVSDFWSLPQNVVFSSAQRAEGTNPSDGVLHAGDVAKFSLNLNPKRGDNAKPNSFYHNIGSVGSPGGEAPIERVQSQGQPAAQSGGSWASEPATTSEPFVDKWDLKDIHIRKAQALNLLTEVLTSGDKVNAPKIVVAMGFTDAAEAIDAVANGWNSLRRGLPIEFPVAVSDLEEEVVAEDSPMVEAAVDLGADVIEEDVESVSWD